MNTKVKTIIAICLSLVFLSLIWLFLFRIKCNNKIDLDINKIDAVFYDIKLDLDTSNKILTEEVMMEIRNNTTKSFDEIIINDMTQSLLKYYKENYDPESTLTSNIINIKTNDKELKFKREKESFIRVKLNEKLKPGDTIKIVVYMKTDIPERQDRFGYIKRDDGDIYALSFCFPYLADNINGEWILNPYFDDGESRSYDLANYKIEINHPKGYLVVATGKEKTDNGVTKITANNVRDIAIVLSNMMKKDSFEIDGININNYYLDSEYTEKYRKLTKLIIEDAIKVYTDNIGKYPYEELDVVPLLFGFGYGGMEYPSLIMTNATSFYDGAIVDPWSLFEGLSHEIAHQWFYATVGNDEYLDAWIDEGFTTYLERQIFSLYDGDAYKYLLEIDDFAPSLNERLEMEYQLINDARKDFKNIYLNVSPEKYTEGQSYGEAEYEASYMFLQELRITMGEDKFNSFLKQLYKEYYFKILNVDIILSLIKEYDNSKKVDEIIKFYFKK